MAGIVKKILLLCLNYPPELIGVGKYVGEMADDLVARGFEVRVITAPPHYPAWQVPPSYQVAAYGQERSGGVRVFRCPLYVPRRPTGARRILHLLSFALSSLPVAVWQALVWRPDVVMVIEPPIMCAPAALLAAKLAGAKAWLHVQDFEIDAAFDLGLLQGGFWQNTALWLERVLMKGFDRVSTISQAMVTALADKKVRASKRMFFPNWVDTQVIAPVDGPSRLRGDWGIGNEAVLVLYAGNLGKKQGIEVLIAAAGLLHQHPLIQFLIVGEGTERAEVVSSARELTNVRFLPLQPADRLAELLQAADIHVLPQRAEAEAIVMPSKLMSMMASGRPVVATARAGSAVATLVRVGGVVSAPGDAAALAAAIRDLADAPELRAQLGAAGRDFAVQHFERRIVLDAAFSAESFAGL
jgi:colanic acid biosynthesis glycosyl transferase WcaI